MDHDPLTRQLSLRRIEEQLIETEIDLASERAASRACRKRQLPSNRSDWNDAIWRRYLAEAVQMECAYGRSLRQIRMEITNIEQLSMPRLPFDPALLMEPKIPKHRMLVVEELVLRDHGGFIVKANSPDAAAALLVNAHDDAP